QEAGIEQVDEPAEAFVPAGVLEKGFHDYTITCLTTVGFVYRRRPLACRGPVPVVVMGPGR
ncbi:hypothetical protein, partial [Actinomadura sp. NPDC000929]|uniref:hypothetical protein n=1 Tax=Actinomadura sp. NPDC000929 TaxID=3154517 RepID=UPI00339ACF3B